MSSPITIFILCFSIFFAFYLFVCLISIFDIYSTKDNYIQFYRNKRGKEPSKARIFFSARGLYDMDFYFSEMSKKSFRKRTLKFDVIIFIFIVVFMLLVASAISSI